MSLTVETKMDLKADEMGFHTVRAYRAGNIVTDALVDPRIPAGWKPRLKAIATPKAGAKPDRADDRLPAVISELIRSKETPKKDTVQKIADLPYLTMRCLVRTENGDVPMHALKPGDKVLTRDNGYQPVVWVGLRKVRTWQLEEKSPMSLIRIEAGALAENMPESEMLVTPGQAFLMTPASHWHGLGVSEMLVRAADLLSLEGVKEIEANKVGLGQILLDSHEVIMVNGAWTGSLRPDPDRVEAMPDRHRQELVSRFPELVDEVPSKPFDSARVELKPQTALYLMNQPV